MSKSKKSTNTPTPAPTATQQLETLLNIPVSEQVHRLFESGAVNDTTTFGEFDAILAQDAKEQTAVYAIKEWFDTLDPEDMSVEQGETAAEFMVAWWLLDPRDFTRNFAD